VSEELKRVKLESAGSPGRDGELEERTIVVLGAIRDSEVVLERSVGNDSPQLCSEMEVCEKYGD